jgi:hypothetical protein
MKMTVLLLTLSLFVCACEPVPIQLTDTPQAPEKSGTSSVTLTPYAFVSPIGGNAFAFYSPILSAPIEPLDVKKIPTPLPSKATIVGRIRSSPAKGSRPYADTIVRLATVVWNEDKSDGAYFLDGARSPGSITDINGTFVFSNIDPGDYVMILGDVMGTSVVITEQNGKRARIFTAKTGELQNVGIIEVDIEPTG